MAYKARFRPSEVLTGGQWRMLAETDLARIPQDENAQLVQVTSA